MALTLADRIKQYTTTTGTGDISLAGTPAGFVTFSSVLSNGDITYYAIEENDKWEVGVGTYGSDNMVRSYVLDSSNGGSHIVLGGSGTVFVTYPADKSVYRDQESRIVVGPSGLVFDNGATLKDLKLTELTDVTTSGIIASTHVLALNNTNKSLLLGDVTGPSNSNNTLIGYGAGSGITSATDNVAVGTESAIANDAGIENVSVGVLSGPSETIYTNPASYVVSVGYKAGSRAKSEVTAIGHQAGMAAYETGFVAVGFAAGSGIGSYSVGVGKEAAHGISSDYVVAVGHQAAKSAAGESSVWIGNMAGSSASSSTRSIGIGYQAGKSSFATDSIYIGQSAGQGSSDDDYLYISNGPPSSSRTLIKGDMQSKKLAVGKADVTLEDTFYIGVASSVDKGLVVKSAAGQSADLTQWQTSAGSSLASVSNLGVVTANQVVASGQGLKLPSVVPVPTTNILYNDAGTLKFNGSAVGGGDVTTGQLNYVSGVATYASGQAIDNETDIVTTTTVANYASGEALSLNAASGQAVYASGNTANIAFGLDDVGDILYHDGTSFTRLAKGTDNHVLTMNVNVPNWEASSGGGGGTSDEAIYASGEALSLTHASGLTVTNASDIVAVSGIAHYASGEVIANKADIVTTTAVANYASGEALSLNAASGQAVYASGQAIANEADIVTTTAVANYASGEALSLNAASGQAVYASGQAIANEADIVTTTAVANYASGEALSLNAASGQAVYASGQAIANEADIVTTTAVANYASGEAVSLNYVSGVATYASGQVDVATDGTAEASKALILDSAKSFTGVKNGTFDQFDSWLYTSGVNVGNSGVVLARNVPADTGDTLYNMAGTLYFNGSQLSSAGGASAEAQYASGEALSLTHASGLTVTNASDIVATSNTANYASGEALSLTHASGLTVTNASDIVATSNTANYASGEALSLTHASGLTVTNAGGISANTSSIGTNTSDIVYVSGIAHYASGEALSLNAASGQAVYASGNTANIAFGSNVEGDILYRDDASFTRLAKGADGHVLTMAGNVPNWEASSGGGGGTSDEAIYASGEALSLTHASGLTVTNAGGISANTSSIGTNTSDIVYVSGIALYASGEALSLTHASGLTVTNASDIVATSNTANYASGEALSLTHASGLTVTNASDIVATSNTANYASGEALSLTHASGLTVTNASDIVATSNTANYASGEALSLTHASGLTVTNASDIVATSNTANYASGEALSLTHASGLTVTNASDIVATSNTANYASGEALSLTHASGLTVTNAGGISANTSSIGTNTSDIVYVSGIALYASGEALSLTHASGVANYASGEALSLNEVSGIVANYVTGVQLNTLRDVSYGGTNLSRTLLMNNHPGGYPSHGTLGMDNSDNVGIGYEALSSITYAKQNVSVGAAANKNCTTGGYNVAIGPHALLENLSGSDNIGIGRAALSGVVTGGVITGNNNIGIGQLSGRGVTSGHRNIFIGYSAGWSHTSESSMLYIADGQDIYDGTLIKGDMDNKYLAVGKADVTLDTDPATLQIYSNGATDKVLLVRGIAAQSDDLTSWQTSTGAVVAAMTPAGTLNAYSVTASGKVGIGTTSPSYPLHVVAHNGTIMCSGVRGYRLDNGDTDGTTQFDINQSTVHAITLDQNATFSVTNARDGDRFMVRVLNSDGAGTAPHTVTWWSTIKWAGNVTPTLSANNKADLLGFLCTGTNAYDGFIVGQDI